jgi:hypothetical protein
MNAGGSQAEGSESRRGRSPRVALARAALAFVAAVMQAGCAETRGGPWETSPAAEVELQVHNDNFLDVAIYALQNGGRVRLGSVTGKSRAALKIPASAVVRADGFRLEVDPVGSPETYVTERILASPGSVVVLDVGSVLRMSSWHLR